MKASDVYTFNNYVVCSKNALAYAVSNHTVEYVWRSESSCLPYCNSFIYGCTGTGKTHLLYAIKNAVIRRRPSARIMFTSCEEITDMLIEAVINESEGDFITEVASSDLLLIERHGVYQS